MIKLTEFQPQSKGLERAKTSFQSDISALLSGDFSQSLEERETFRMYALKNHSFHNPMAEACELGRPLVSWEKKRHTVSPKSACTPSSKT